MPQSVESAASNVRLKSKHPAPIESTHTLSSRRAGKCARTLAAAICDGLFANTPPSTYTGAPGRTRYGGKYVGAADVIIAASIARSSLSGSTGPATRGTFDIRAGRHDRTSPPGGGTARDHIVGGGLARNTKFDETVRLNYAFGVWRRTATHRTVIPVHLGVEGDLNSWITARAGLSYNLYDRTNNVSTADTTAGSLGATVHVGKVDFDWAIGHVGSGEDVNDGGFGLDSGFFTAASLTYSW